MTSVEGGIFLYVLLGRKVSNYDMSETSFVNGPLDVWAYILHY
jgi:hypothetical protein